MGNSELILANLEFFKDKLCNFLGLFISFNDLLFDDLCILCFLIALQSSPLLDRLQPEGRPISVSVHRDIVEKLKKMVFLEESLSLAIFRFLSQHIVQSVIFQGLGQVVNVLRSNRLIDFLDWRACLLLLFF